MKPSLYLYKENQADVEIYLGECSTLDGLSLLPDDSRIEINTFGATSYQSYGFATENEIPKLETIGSTKQFLANVGDIGLVDFEISVDGIGTFGTHDDGECHFRIGTKSQAIDLLNKVLPQEYSGLILNELINNQDQYIECDPEGRIGKYATFDDYLAKRV